MDPSVRLSQLRDKVLELEQLAEGLRETAFQSKMIRKEWFLNHLAWKETWLKETKLEDT
jgi:hypothetical protein